MNTESVDCRKVLMGLMEQVGDFAFDNEYSHIYVWFPGVSGPDALPIVRGASNAERVWGWDCNTVKPTLTPSILHPLIWHGYLRAGRLVTC
jgi:hypothetical protein